AALALGVVVVQAAVRSGSLITAHHALALGREVWAVPGPIDAPLSAGPHALLVDGAGLVRSADDVLDALSLAQRAQLTLPFAPTASTPPTDARAAARAAAPDVAALPRPSGLAGDVWDALPAGGGEEARTADDLANALDVAVAQVLSALLTLELEGRVAVEPGPCYRRRG
ncbi:MAG: DNA-processing protein DprA, partial [Acidobacteriota bacterium]